MESNPEIIKQNKELSRIPSQESKSDLPAPAEWTQLKEICQIAVKSRLIPQKTWEEAVTVALKGRELGIPPMQSFTHINVIAGKVAPSPELMLALIWKKFPAAKFEYLERSDKACRINVTRPGQKTEEWSFTIEDAQKMGLTNKDNYKKQAATMLQWRCISQIARAKFSDALMGASHTPEELGATVNEETGEVIDVTVSSERSEPKNALILESEGSAPSDPLENPGDYLITFGQYGKDGGTKLRDINPVSLARLYDFMRNQKKLHGLNHMEFYQAYERYIQKNDPKDEPEVLTGMEEIPDWVDETR